MTETVTEEIYETESVNCDEMIKLLEDFYNINQIQHSLSTIILRQRNKLDSIRDNIVRNAK